MALELPEDYEALGTPDYGDTKTAEGIDRHGMDAWQVAADWETRAAIWEREGFRPTIIAGLTIERCIELGDIQFRKWWISERFPPTKCPDGRVRHAARPGTPLTARDLADIEAMNARSAIETPPKPMTATEAGAALAEAGVPKLFANYALSGIEPEPKLATWCKAAANGSGAWFYIGGGTGAGKTTQAACAALSLLHGRTRPKFVNARALKQAWNAGGLYGTASRPTKAEAIADYKSASVLLLDGLGEEDTDRAFVDCLFDLIDHRHVEALPTLITSQLGLSEYRDRMARACGDEQAAYAIASRIGGNMGGAAGYADNLLVMGGEDRRTA